MKTIDGHRVQLWPIRIRFNAAAKAKFLHRHYWQTGTESTEDGSTADGMMPGLRRVLGQTIHLGPVKLLLGGDL